MVNYITITLSCYMIFYNYTDTYQEIHVHLDNNFSQKIIFKWNIFCNFLALRVAFIISHNFLLSPSVLGKYQFAALFSWEAQYYFELLVHYKAITKIL